MNLNSSLITQLHTATGLPVAQDEYDGNEDKYIIFVYADETPALEADNLPVVDRALMQVQLRTPKSYNYMTLKHTIRNTLESMGGIVQSIRTFLGDEINGTEKIRTTAIEVEFYESRTQEE